MDLDLWLYPEDDYASGGMLIFDEGELGCEIQKNTGACGFTVNNDTSAGGKAAFLAA